MLRASRGISTPVSVVVLVGLLASLLAVGWLAPAPAARADFTPHSGLVPQIPVMGYPVILKTPMLVEGGTPNYNKPESREVLAADQVGRAIVSGGNFREIELQDGSVIQQPYFAAWNIDTKQMMCQQKFVFDNDVLAIAAGPRAGTLYVGGRFTKITDASGVTRNRVRLALINLDTCMVEVGFNVGGISSKVDEIVFGSNRLFIGGDFDSIGGLAIETIAELDPSTGTVNPVFNFTTTGELVSRIQAMGFNTDGTRLIIAGRWGTMVRRGVSVVNPTAVINISNPADPTLTAHRSSGTVAIKDMQDASVAPDGTTIGLVFGTATISDYVYLFPTTETSVTRRWVHFMRDSGFGIGVSNNAVYVAGHFCKPDSGPGASDPMSPQMGLDLCTGTNGNYAGGVWRSHLAALSPTDGTPLPWNPGQGSHTGATELTVTTRGLLVGYDGDRTASRRVGALAFFDFGAGVEDVTPPGPVTFASPTPGQALNNPALLKGRADDDFGIASYKVSVQAADGRWVQADGSLGAARYDFTVAPRQDGSFELSVSLPAGNYTAYARALDAAGLRSATDTTVDFVETGIEGVRPESSLVIPQGPLLTEAGFTIAGKATDNVEIASIVVYVRTPGGRYLQADGTLADTRAALPVTVTAGGLNSPTATWSLDIPKTLPANTFNVEVVVQDASGNVATSTGSFALKANAPVVAMNSPASQMLNEDAFAISGVVSDDTRVASIKVQVKNAAGDFLRSNGTFGAAQNLPVTIDGLGTASANFQYDAGILPIGDYQVIVTAKDGIPNVSVATRDVRVTDVVENKTPLLTSYTGFSGAAANYTMGYSFKVGARTTMSAVGLFDADKDGVNDNPADTRFGIWKDGNSTPLAQGTIPRGAASENGWFYGDLAAPLTLEPNVIYVVAVLHRADGEQYGYGGTVTKDANLVMVASAYASGTVLTYPSTRIGTWYSVPNLKTVTTLSSKPQVTVTSPATEVEFGQATKIEADVTDNTKIASVNARLTNAAGDYLQDDGSFAAMVNDLDASVTGLGTAAARISFTAQALPAGNYTATVIAADPVNNTGTASRSFAVVVAPKLIAAISGYTGYSVSAGDLSLGYAFRVTRATKLWEVGIQDSNNDGALNNATDTPFSIWRQSDRALLASGVVAKAASAQSGWFYGKLASPLTLQPGVTYVVAHRTYLGGESYAYAGAMTKNDIFEYMGSAYAVAASPLPYPALPGAPVGYGVPNLRFVDP